METKNVSIASSPEQQNPQAEQDKNLKKSLGKITHKLLVMSGKGGVGKTSTSVNLSLALASKGFKVGDHGSRRPVWIYPAWETGLQVSVSRRKLAQAVRAIEQEIATKQ